MSWEEFFKQHEDYSVQASFYENRRDFTMEELYQAFRARFLDEMLDASMSRGDDDISALLAQMKYRPADQSNSVHDSGLSTKREQS